MTTPRGGPGQEPDATRGWAPVPDPSATTWGPPPQGPPGPWPGPVPGPAPAGPPGWSDPGRGGPQPSGAWPGPPPSGAWSGPPPAWGGQPPPGYPPTAQQWSPQPAWGAPQPAWGAPAPGWGGPPPRKERGRLVALLVVGALVLAGLGVGTFLLVRTATTAAEPDGPTVPADYRTVATSALSFAVPPGWEDSTDPAPTLVLGAELAGLTYGPAYPCDDSTYFRGVVGAAFVEGERPAAAVAETFGRETGRRFYGSAGEPEVTLSAPRPVDVGGAAGQLVEATITVPIDDGCLATGGTILVLAVPTSGTGGVPGTAVLVVNGDTVGGPASAPPIPDRAVLDAMIASARLPTI